MYVLEGNKEKTQETIFNKDTGTTATIGVFALGGAVAPKVAKVVYSGFVAESGAKTLLNPSTKNIAETGVLVAPSLIVPALKIKQKLYPDADFKTTSSGFEKANVKGTNLETFRFKGEGSIEGKPYSQETVVSDVRLPENSITAIKQGKFDILVSKTEQTVTTSKFKKGKLIETKTEPYNPNEFIDLELTRNPVTKSKVLDTKDTAFTSELKFLSETNAKYKVDELNVKRGVLSKTVESIRLR